MKNIKILILLMLCSFGLSAQIINDNTDVNTSGNVEKEVLSWNGTDWVNSRVDSLIAGYPFIFFYDNDFTSSTTGVAAFNGGTFSIVSDKLRVIGSSAARGVTIGPAKTEGLEYFVKLTIDGADPVNGVRLVSEWADNIQSPLFDGTHEFYFTEPIDGGGDEKLTITTNGLDTFFVSNLSIFEVNPNRDISTNKDTRDAVATGLSQTYTDLDYLMFNDFVDDTDGATIFSGTLVKGDDYVEIVSTTGGQPIVLARGLFPDTCTIEYVLDVEIVDNEPIIIKPVWGQNVLSDTIYTTGVYRGKLRREYVQGVSQLNGLVLVKLSADTATVRLKSALVKLIKEENRDYLWYQHMGANINARKENTSIVVGNNVNQGFDQTSLGHLNFGSNNIAGLRWTRRFSGSYTTGESTSIGNGVYSASARNTAIGEKTVAVGQSSTAVGAGAEVHTSHGSVYGRGAYLGMYPHINSIASHSQVETGNTFNIDSKHFYMNNGWGHVFPQEVSRHSLSNRLGTTSGKVTIHGLDAFDARHPQWLVGTTYKEDDIVFHSDTSWISNSAGNIGNTPSLTNPTNWTFWQRDEKGAASDFAFPGFDLELMAGRGTNTEQSGRVVISLAEGSNGANVKDTPFEAAAFVSDDTQTDGTFLWLLNEATGTMQRVVVDAKPSASGTNGIVGFSQGYKPE